MNDPIFEARSLRMSFGRKPVLRSLDLTLHRGQVTVLLGENGSGKSTLMRLAIGALRAVDGELRVVGRDPLRATNAVRESVGYLPDVPDAYDWMTPIDLFRFLAAHYPTWDEVHRRELCDLLEVPIGTRLGNQSRGQGMKTMLVAALAFRPPLLLLDEPFAGLDPLVRDDVLQGVLASLRGQDVTVLCATHDLEIAARLADRVAVLAGGQIARHDEVDTVLASGESGTSAMKRALAETAPQEVTPCMR